MLFYMSIAEINSQQEKLDVYIRTNKLLRKTKKEYRLAKLNFRKISFHTIDINQLKSEKKVKNTFLLNENFKTLSIKVSKYFLVVDLKEHNCTAR